MKSHENTFLFGNENKEGFRTRPNANLEENISIEKIEFNDEFSKTKVKPHENTFFTKPTFIDGKKESLQIRPTENFEEDISIEKSDLNDEFHKTHVKPHENTFFTKPISGKGNQEVFQIK